MRLTRFSDIGLRVLIYLAGAGERRTQVTVGEIAGQFDIPANHLVKVVGQLARTGWVQATRGRNGGLRLNVAAASLKIGEVLRTLEGEAELADCTGQSCRLSPDCILRGALAEGLQAFYAAMDHYTLADIAAGSSGQKIIRMHRDFMRQIA